MQISSRFPIQIWSFGKILILKSKIIKDPRVSQADNDQFLNTMEKYFDDRGKKLYAKQELKDVFPETGY